MEEKKQYYEVCVAVGPTWRTNVFTYESTDELRKGDVVLAPFGRTVHAGFILAKTNKPSMKTRLIQQRLDMRLPLESQRLFDWLIHHYPNLPGAHAQHLLPSFLKQKAPKKLVGTEQETKDLPQLTLVQKAALKALNGPRSTYVLHGITGSGKTRVYIELIKNVLSDGKNALLTYPEISLTPQLEKSLVQTFGSDKVAIFHSKLSKSQQYREWLRVNNSKGGIVTIGPRSSLFMPHQNLGLVVVDEAHDGSYKQDNGTRYNGLHVAAKLASIHEAKLILGSATPPIQETHQILEKGGSLVCMHDLAIKHSFENKDFLVVDMTKKDNLSSDSYLLSKKLLQQISKSLDEKMQVLLFLNRRGTAHSLLCTTCGWHAECPRCEMPLTYHHDNYRVQCHLCGYSSVSPSICPECKNDLSQRSLGTKAIENDLKKLFPQARVARFDSDNKKVDSLTENFEAVRSGNVDILIGTQLVTKGLDLPKLQTVGVLQADSQLFLPDFSSEERAFQQLTQVSGRVGRGHSKGSVILQSYQPDNGLFKSVENQDWHSFYEEQISKRQLMQYPPFSYFMKITCAKNTPKSAEAFLKKFAEQISNSNIKLFGPAASFYTKRAGKHVWQLVLRSPSRKQLAAVAERLPKDFQYDLDPISLL